MTWNVWWRFGDWERREPAIVTVVRDQQPDIVVLQEAWAVRRDGVVTEQVRRLADAWGMHAVATGPQWFDDRSFHNAILSRWPLARLDDHALPGVDGRPGHRRALVAAVDSPWGSWPVVSTHLDHRFDGSQTRRRQVSRLLEVVVAHRGDPEHDLPVIVGADVNATPDSDEIRMATGRAGGGPGGVVLSDVWEQAGDGDGHTWCRSNPHVADSTWPGRRIDQLLVSWPRPRPVGNPVRAWLAGHLPVDVEGDAVWASDHAAVVADLIAPAD
jgi:endonuclease/exonuclease/phosphatase family metal-dependent hydrolase